MNLFIHKKTAALLTITALLSGLLSPSIYASEPTAPAIPVMTQAKLHALIQEAQNKQSSATISAPSIIADDINTASTDLINVIIQLSNQPVAVGRYAAKMGYQKVAAEATEVNVQTEQSIFLNLASQQGITLQVHYQYETVLNGMEVTVRANDIPKLAQLPGVTSIHKNQDYYAIPVPADVETQGLDNPIFDINPLKQIGADIAWDKGFTGAGVKVGVIDTGGDYLHPDLKDAMDPLNKGYDAYYQDDDPYEDSDLDGATEHGTHVSGTIVGRFANPTSEFVQKGVAYGAKLYLYKVLGGKHGTGSSAQIIAGIERAVKDKMDVINLSLGSAAYKDPNSPDSIALNNAVLAGVVAVAANGNDGAGIPYYYSMGSPASAHLAISVAAATSPSRHYNSSLESTVSVSSVTYATYQSNPRLVSWKKDETQFASLLGDQSLEAVFVNFGRDQDYNLYEGDLSGKIALISRGVNAIEEKVVNAAKYNASAAIIFNGNAAFDAQGEVIGIDLSEDIPGRDGPIGTLAGLGEDRKYLPTFDMSGKEGRALARALLTNPGSTLKISFGSTFNPVDLIGDTIAEFSSRGPNSDNNYGIKPDISAPGVNIMSTLPAYAKEFPWKSYDEAYGRMSGTSMAAPHITGLVALLLEKYKDVDKNNDGIADWSPMDYRAALANTSEMISDLGGTLYDVYSQGAGRANVANALATPALLEAMDPLTIHNFKLEPITMESNASSVSFGLIDPKLNKAVDKPLQIKNMSDEALTYAASVVMHPHVTSDPNKPIPTPDIGRIQMLINGQDANSDQTIAVGPNARQSFTLSALATADAPNGVYEGHVLLKSADPDHPELHLPFVIHIGEGSDNNQFVLQDMTLSDQTINADEKIDLSVTINSDTQQYMVFYALGLEAIGPNDPVPTVGEIYDLDQETGEFKPIPRGKLTFHEIGNSVGYTMDYQLNVNTVKLPDGLYNFVVVSYSDLRDPNSFSIAYKPFYVSSEPTTETPPPSPPVSGGGGGGGALPEAPKTNLELIESIVPQGQASVSVTASTTMQGKQLTATVADSDIQKALDAAKSATTSIVVNAGSTDSSEAQLKLTNAQVLKLQQAAEGSTVVFAWNGATIATPVSAFTSVPAGADYVVQITKDASSTSTFAKQYPDASVVGTPYAFEASTVIGGTATPLSLTAKQVFKRAFIVDQEVNESKTGALYIENGQVYPVPALFTAAGAGKTIVSISRPGFSTYAVAQHQTTFADIDSSWAKSHIQLLADKFLLNGTSDSTFSPKNNVTRAEFASLLVRSLGLQKPTSATPFKDVHSSDWYAQSVAIAYEAGLVTGYGDTFEPNASISRQDLTVMLTRALKLLQVTKTATSAPIAYADAEQFSDYAKDSIQFVTYAGLMDGIDTNEGTHFQPTEPTTREAVAKVLSSLLKLSKLIN
ncbi:subtilisin family serine protease [Paenibacillus qinlingensis]|uniref:Subtilisin family serine protease n=1 Tax=Paenibacillus qinlingensis TaxID=1837343 RepID=A0ABU1NVA4_9BACL|nr:subtilisin family serine protease [Paenibacillus qinlingensis]